MPTAWRFRFTRLTVVSVRVAIAADRRRAFRKRTIDRARRAARPFSCGKRLSSRAHSIRRSPESRRGRPRLCAPSPLPRLTLDTDRTQDFRDRYKRLLAYATATGYLPPTAASRSAATRDLHVLG